jgi:hypothetical protein
MEMKAQASGQVRFGHRPAALAAVVLAGLIAGCAAVGPAALAGKEAERHQLKDGNTLLVDSGGRMRMLSPGGSSVHMKDGVPMETRDGRVVVMKEDLRWKQLREFGTLSPKSR